MKLIDQCPSFLHMWCRFPSLIPFPTHLSCKYYFCSSWVQTAAATTSSRLCFVFDTQHLVFLLPSPVTSEAGVRPYSSSSNWQWTALDKELYKYSPLWFSPWKCDNVLVQLLEVRRTEPGTVLEDRRSLVNALGWALPFCCSVSLWACKQLLHTTCCPFASSQLRSAALFSSAQPRVSPLRLRRSLLSQYPSISFSISKF